MGAPKKINQADVPTQTHDPQLKRVAERPDTLPAGTVIDDFELLGELGRGGFATVYRARQLSLGRIVALKVTGNEGTEARTVARLEHDCIVPVFSETIFAPKNLRLICMLYVPGMTLEQLLVHFSEAPKPVNGEQLLAPLNADATNKGTGERSLFKNYATPEAVLSLALDLASALEHAHAKGLIHADIKPANILIHPDGRAFLLDFNVSRNHGGHTDHNGNPVGGTFEYMAPEQFDAFYTGDLKAGLHATTVRSDIFSLGVVLRDLCLIMGLTEKIFPDLFRMLACCTAPNPNDRYESALDLAAALRGCLDLYTMQSAMPPAGPFATFGSRRPILLLTAGGFVIQFIASLVSTGYNEINVVSQLTPPQQTFFKLLLLTYNPLCFFVGMTLWLLAMKRLKSYLDAPEKFSADETSAFRQDVQRIPTWVFLLSFCSWMPGSLFFPLALHLVAGPLPGTVFLHLILSFWLSCAIALSYGLLFADYVVVRCLYLRFWNPLERVRQVARQELLPSLTRIKFCQLAVGWAPIWGAMIILGVGPDRLEPVRYRYFSLLVTLLLSLGIGGIYFGIRASYLLIDAFQALTNPRRQ